SQQRWQRFLPDIIRPERLPTGFCIITKPMTSLIRYMSLPDLTAIHRDLFSLHDINTAIPFFQQTRKPVALEESIKPSLKGISLTLWCPFAFGSGSKTARSSSDRLHSHEIRSRFTTRQSEKPTTTLSLIY